MIERRRASAGAAREATSAEVDLSPGSIAFSSEAPVIKMKVRDGAVHAAFVLARI